MVVFCRSLQCKYNSVRVYITAVLHNDCNYAAKRLSFLLHNNLFYSACFFKYHFNHF